MTTRRGFLGAMLAAAAAPAIVRASSLMPIVVRPRPVWTFSEGEAISIVNPRAMEAFFKTMEPPASEEWAEVVSGTAGDEYKGPILRGELGRMYGMTIIESTFVGSARDLDRYKRQHARRQHAQPSNALRELLEKARDLSNLKIRS